MIVFEPTEKLVKWMHKHCETCHSNGSAGEHFQWVFLPTGIVECQTIKCIICGEELTDYV